MRNMIEIKYVFDGKLILNNMSGEMAVIGEDYSEP